MFGWIANAYNSVVGSIDDTIRNWVHNIISVLYSFLHSIFGLVGHAWLDLADAGRLIRSALDNLGHWTYMVLHRLIKVYLPSLTRWITRTILDPLLNAIKWIAREGNTMWHYFTHPGRLVDLIYDYIVAKIETTAWNTAEKLGKFFISLFAHHMKRFLELIEDVIHATL